MRDEKLALTDLIRTLEGRLVILTAPFLVLSLLCSMQP